MLTISISAVSLQYVRARVTATKSGQPYDPTSDVVQMAFIPEMPLLTNPAPGDWRAAVWETVGTTYNAMCLVGPGGTVALTRGTYVQWVRVTDNPEIPAMIAGLVQVT